MSLEIGPISVPGTRKGPNVLFVRKFTDYEHRLKGRVLMLNTPSFGNDKKSLAVHFRKGAISGIYVQHSQDELEAFTRLASDDSVSSLVLKEVERILKSAPTID